RRVACARNAVLDHFPLAGHGGANHTRALAVPDPDLAGVGARDRDRVRAIEQRGDLDPGRAISVAAFAEHVVRRGGAGDPQSDHALAWPDLSEPAAGRCARRADAAGREPDHRLAADRGPGRGNYPAVRGGLRYLSASRRSRVDHDPQKRKTVSREDDAHTKIYLLSHLISSG